MARRELFSARESNGFIGMLSQLRSCYAVIPTRPTLDDGEIVFSRLFLTLPISSSSRRSIASCKYDCVYPVSEYASSGSPSCIVQWSKKGCAFVRLSCKSTGWI